MMEEKQKYKLDDGDISKDIMNISFRDAKDGADAKASISGVTLVR